MKNPFASLFRARDKPGRNEKPMDSVSTAATRGTAICTQMSTPSPPHSSADSRDTAPALSAAAVMPWLALAAEIITPLARAAVTANVKPV